MTFIRRDEREVHVVGRYDDGCDRYYDVMLEMTVIKVFSGNIYVTTDPKEIIVTILGSCIAVCMRDVTAGVAGMNHFMMPDSINNDAAQNSARYCGFAMATLVDEMVKKGADISRLEVKVFGGGSVIDGVADIGQDNINAVHTFLENENIPISVEDTGGSHPRRIHFFPKTGKVRVRKLFRKEDMDIINKEYGYVDVNVDEAP